MSMQTDCLNYIKLRVNTILLGSFKEPCRRNIFVALHTQLLAVISIWPFSWVLSLEMLQEVVVIVMWFDVTLISLLSLKRRFSLQTGNKKKNIKHEWQHQRSTDKYVIELQYLSPSLWHHWWQYVQCIVAHSWTVLKGPMHDNKY